MKVRSYPGRAVLEDPELLLDPDATRGRVMELLYEASWRECGVNWASNNNDHKNTDIMRNQRDCSVGLCDIEKDDRPKVAALRRCSSGATIDSSSSELSQQDNQRQGFLIPRPRLIVPVHTYARQRKTGAPTVRRRQLVPGTRICDYCEIMLSWTYQILYLFYRYDSRLACCLSVDIFFH